MTSKETLTTSESDHMSAALDPHRRESMLHALDDVFADFGDQTPTVALVGWQAATLLDAVYERAARFVIVEDREAFVESIQKGLRTLDVAKKVELVAKSPEEVELDDKVDVAVMSVRSTWFIEGDEASALQNLRQNVVAAGGRLVPSRLSHLFELTASPTGAAGMPLRVPRHSRPGEPVPVLSESKHFITHTLDGASELPEAIDDTIIVKPLLSGRVSALRLTTLCELTDGVVQVTSESGLQSIVIPLREDVEVEAGQPVEIHIRFRLGAGLDTAKFSARALPHDRGGEWELADSEVVDNFRERVGEMVDMIERRGRGEDLDRVVGYTIEPHGDVSRLTALFWTIDDEYRQTLRDVVDSFRQEASQHGATPTDEVIYDTMLEVYNARRG
ncbi:MAG: hypothetical protein ACQEVA_21690 [Myxococcota bacterium]